MILDQCVSVTELKKDTKNIISSLKEKGPIVIFVNNKPVAVLKDIEDSNLTLKEEEFHFNFGDEGIDPKVILDHFKK